MKITKTQLKQIIKEEIAKVMHEDDMGPASPYSRLERRAAELFACAADVPEVHKLFYDAAASQLSPAEYRNRMKVKEVSVTEDMVKDAFNADKAHGKAATYGSNGDTWLLNVLDLMKTC
jgi:hypothetical protein